MKISDMLFLALAFFIGMFYQWFWDKYIDRMGRKDG